MTDRVQGYVVILDENMREDDAEAVVQALRMVRGVLDVQPVPATIETHVAEERARLKLLQQLWDFLAAPKKEG